MLHHPIGTTGLRVAALGFGGSALGGGVFGPVDQQQATRAVHAALDLGVDLFDTAPFYGETRAESALGRALAGVPRDRYVLATKVGRYGNDVFDFSAARVIASVDESLARLGCGHIDLIQCHDIEFAPSGQICAETLPALERLRAQGKVRAIGITGLPLAAVREVLAQTRVDCVLSYCHHTLADTTLADALPWLRAEGAAVINASPLGMGLLSDAGPPPWHPAPSLVKDACARAATLCRARGGSIGTLALQVSAGLDGVASTLVGVRSSAEIAANVRALSQPIDQELLTAVRAILAPIQGMSWSSGRYDAPPLSEPPDRRAAALPNARAEEIQA